MFIDHAKIRVEAGSGGDGCVSFRREKFITKGGPDGGDGGHGGNVIIIGKGNMNTLINYRHIQTIKADDGIYGDGGNRTGKSGKNEYVFVPVGTEVYEITDEGRVKIADITEIGQEIVIAKGGRGGKGNSNFATATHRAPRKATPGRPGEQKSLELVLKLMADVGLVGFPNAGKSTLLSAVSAARPKIADYEFTTLEPSLGVISVSEYESFVMADIPGIIEGAHMGKGLGIQFLQHIQRTKVLLFLLDINSPDPLHDYQILKNELHSYDDYLDKKPHLIVMSKIDTIPEEDLEGKLVELRDAFAEQMHEEIIAISSVASKNLMQLKQKLFALIT
ncbi:MAG: GTPase ObgE [Candidatus Cloacimonetes bacterium]|nr:GTPase ObgE [Candidatus Cloacimonadota bacterium]